MTVKQLFAPLHLWLLSAIFVVAAFIIFLAGFVTLATSVFVVGIARLFVWPLVEVCKFAETHILEWFHD